jgi:phage terminase large subunit-like protein
MIAWKQAKQFIEEHFKQAKDRWFGKQLQILPWQEEFLKPLFDDDDVRICSVWTPRKNGKSTIAASCALTVLMSEPGAEVYIICALTTQAEHLFRTIVDAIDLDPDLSKLAKNKTLWVREHKSTIEYRRNKSILKVLSTDPRRSSLNASLVICDELAEWGCHGRNVWDKITTGGIARKGKILTLSTAQYDLHGLGREIFLRARDAKENPAKHRGWLGVIHSLAETEDPGLPENWWRVNPSAGVTVPKEEYYLAWEQTKDNPRELTKFQTFLLCQWVGSAERWIAPHRWNQTATTRRLEDFHGSEILIGLDASSKHDLTAYSIFIERDGQYYVFPRFFIPESRALLKEKTDNVPYRTWANQGHITLTDGDRIDIQAVIDSILEDTKHFKVNALIYDPYGLELARQQLEYAHGFECIELPPSPAKLSPACGFFEREVLAGRLHHPANPVLDWNLGNVAVKTIQDKVYLDKRKMTQRIDGVSAALLAIWHYLEQDENLICGSPLIL